MSVKVKICGLTRLEEVGFANKLLPDYVGFIFAERSRRRISLKTAKEFKGRYTLQFQLLEYSSTLRRPKL